MSSGPPPGAPGGAPGGAPPGPPQPQVAPNSSPDLRALVFTVMVLFMTLSLLLVLSRLYSRKLMKYFWWDDWMVVIGWLMSSAYACGICYAVTLGFGRRSASFTSPEYIEILKTTRIVQGIAVLSFIPTKLAIGLTIMRIIPGKRLHIFIWSVLISFAILHIINPILWFLECRPVTAIWNRRPDSNCWSPNVYLHFAWFTSAWNTLTDFILAVIPWFHIPKLNMKRRERIAISVAMSLGVFAGITSIIRAVALRSLGALTDYAYDTIPLQMWAATELLCLQIAACLPLLRPLVQKMGGKWKSIRSNSKGLSYGSSNGTGGGTGGSYPLQKSGGKLSSAGGGTFDQSRHQRLGSMTGSEEAILVETGAVRPPVPELQQARRQPVMPIQYTQEYDVRYSDAARRGPRSPEPKQYGLMG